MSLPLIKSSFVESGPLIYYNTFFSLSGRTVFVSKKYNTLYWSWSICQPTKMSEACNFLWLNWVWIAVAVATILVFCLLIYLFSRCESVVRPLYCIMIFQLFGIFMAVCDKQPCRWESLQPLMFILLNLQQESTSLFLGVMVCGGYGFFELIILVSLEII